VKEPDQLVGGRILFGHEVQKSGSVPMDRGDCRRSL
jgi:hypothetical protein